MPKLTVENLKKFRKKAQKKIMFDGSDFKVKVTVHMGTCGIVAGANKIMETLMNEIDTAKIENVLVSTSGCIGLCSKEPMITVELQKKPPVKYADLTKEKMKKIFDEHILGGNIVQKYVFAIGNERTY